MKLSDNSGPDITVKYRVQRDKSNPNHCPEVKTDNECAGVKIKEGDSERKNPVDFEVYVKAFDTSCQDSAKKNQRYDCLFSAGIFYFFAHVNLSVNVMDIIRRKQNIFQSIVAT